MTSRILQVPYETFTNNLHSLNNNIPVIHTFILQPCRYFPPDHSNIARILPPIDFTSIGIFDMRPLTRISWGEKLTGLQEKVELLVGDKWPHLRSEIQSLIVHGILPEKDLAQTLEEIQKIVDTWVEGPSLEISKFLTGRKDLLDTLWPKLEDLLTQDLLHARINELFTSFQKYAGEIRSSTEINPRDRRAYEQLLFALAFTNQCLCQSSTDLQFQASDLPDITVALGQAIGIASQTMTRFLTMGPPIPTQEINKSFLKLVEVHRMMESLVHARNRAQVIGTSFHQGALVILRAIATKTSNK